MFHASLYSSLCKANLQRDGRPSPETGAALGAWPAHREAGGHLCACGSDGRAGVDAEGLTPAVHPLGKRGMVS